MSIILQIWENFYAVSLQVLTKNKQNIRRVYQDTQPPTPSTPRPRKVTAILNLTCENIQPKTKTKKKKKKKKKKYFQLLKKKSIFVFSRKQRHFPSDYKLQFPVEIQISNDVFKQTRNCKLNWEMGKCKTKAIQADLDIFTHIPAYSDISRHFRVHNFRHIQELSRHIPNPV